MQTVRKQISAPIPASNTMRGDAKPIGPSSAGNKPFVRIPAQAANVDKTTLQSRTAQAMNNTRLVGMSREGIAIANYCGNLPPGTEIDLHTSVNPYVRAYGAGLEALTNTPGPLFVKFDNGMLSIHSRSAMNAYPLLSMHPTEEGIRYMVQGRYLNGSSSLTDVDTAHGHLSMFRLVAQEAVDPQAAREAIAGYQA